MLDPDILTSIREGVSALPQDHLLRDQELTLAGIPQTTLATHAQALIDQGELDGTVVRIGERVGVLVRKLFPIAASAGADSRPAIPG